MGRDQRQAQRERRRQLHIRRIILTVDPSAAAAVVVVEETLLFRDSGSRRGRQDRPLTGNCNRSAQQPPPPVRQRAPRWSEAASLRLDKRKWRGGSNFNNHRQRFDHHRQR